MNFRELLPFLTSRALPLEMKGRLYTSCVRSSMTYGSENRSSLDGVGLKFEIAEMQMIIWMCLFTTQMQISSQLRKPSSPLKHTHKVHNFTTVRADMLHKAGVGLITLHRDNITFTTTDIPSTINTHNTELQMVTVHINNTKHITIANMYIPPRDSTSTHYKTADTDIQHCIQYITNIPHSPEM